MLRAAVLSTKTGVTVLPQMSVMTGAGGAATSTRQGTEEPPSAGTPAISAGISMV